MPEPRPTASSADLASRLGMTATRLARRLRQQAATGLSPSQVAALATIERHGPLSLGALADHERVAPPSITKVVAILSTAGLVSKAPDPDDGRASLVTITAEGTALLTESRQRRTAWLAGRLAELDAGQRHRLTQAVEVLESLLEDARVTRVRLAAHDTFRSMAVRNFRLFFGGQLISQVGNWLTLVAQTLLVLKLTHNGVALGALAAAQFGPVLLLGPWAGLVADRSDKRRLLLIVQTIAMAQSFILAALVFSGQPPLLAIYAVAVVGGVTVAFDNPARRAFVVEMVPTADISNAVSLNSALMTASRVVGPAVAGLLIATVGFGWCFLIDGLSYVAVLAGLWWMRTEELRPSVPAVRGRRQVREGLRYVRRVPELWLPLVMMAVIGTLSYNFQTVFPLFTTRDLDGSAATFTTLFSVVSVGALVGALGAARRTRVTVRTVGLSACAYGAVLALMAVAPNQPVAFLLGPLLGFSSIAFLTSSTAIVQIEAAPEMRGRVLALQAMLFLGTTPIGAPIVGWVSQQFGARYGIGIGAVAALVAGAWGLAAHTADDRLAPSGPITEDITPAAAPARA